MPNNIRLYGGILILLLALTFRYIFYPLALCFNYEPIPKVYEYGNDAIILMCLEMSSIFIVIRFYFKRASITYKGLQSSASSRSGSSTFVLLLLSVVSCYFIFMGNSFLSGKHFVWETSSILDNVDEIDGAASQTFTWFQAFLVIFLLERLSIKYYQTGRYFFYLLSIIICFLPCLVYTGHSRLSLLIPIICSCSLAYKIYGKKAKLAISVALAMGIAVLASLSITKNLNNSSSSSMIELFNPSLLNAYFGGIGNIVTGIQCYEQYGPHLDWLLFDSLRNAMGISSYFTFLPGAGFAFNNLIYGGLSIGSSFDQIVPTVIQGALYFGKFFFFIPSIIMTWVVCKCDEIFSNTDSIEKSYIFSYFPVVIAWSIPGNMMHLTSQFFNFLIPMLILVYINKFLSVRKK